MTKATVFISIFIFCSGITFISETSRSDKIIINNADFEVDYLDSFYELTDSNSIILQENDHLFLSSKTKLLVSNNAYYLPQTDQFQVSKYHEDDSKLQFEITFGGKGKGPGEAIEMDSYTLGANNDFLMYDSSNRKMVCFNSKGNLEYEFLITEEHLPYLLTDLEYLGANTYLGTGVSIDEYKKLNLGNLYSNLYLLEITKQNHMDVFEKYSIIPTDIEEAVYGSYLSASIIRSPFKLTKANDAIYIFNISSNQIFKYAVGNDQRIIQNRIFELGNNIFEKHTNITERELLEDPTKKIREWSSSGDFIVDLFVTKNYMILYMSRLAERGYKNRYKLIFINLNKLHVERVIHFAGQQFVRGVHDDSIFVLSYEEENKSNQGFQLLRIPIEKLF